MLIYFSAGRYECMDWQEDMKVYRKEDMKVYVQEDMNVYM